MTRPAAAARIAARSLVATVEITALASAAHLLAGGRLPPPGFLLAFAVTVFGCAALTLARFLRVATVVPIVLVAQVGLHTSLDGVHVHAGHDAGPATSSAPMLWAHLVTALVTAIVLLVQEQVLAAVLAGLHLPGQVVRVPRARLAARAPVLVVPGRQVLLATSPRRGPPRTLCATS